MINISVHKPKKLSSEARLQKQNIVPKQKLVKSSLKAKLQN